MFDLKRKIDFPENLGLLQIFGQWRVGDIIFGYFLCLKIPNNFINKFRNSFWVRGQGRRLGWRLQKLVLSLGQPTMPMFVIKLKQGFFFSHLVCNSH